jgi:signal transduction histidine kinase
MYQKTGFGGGHGVRRPAEGDPGTVNVAGAERKSSAWDVTLAEVRRLRGVLTGCRSSRDRFDLAEAIEPVLACARSCGLDVRSTVPRGIDVEGCRASTGQVVLALLDNARHHTASSPVEVRVTVVGDVAALYVEDRGLDLPGLSPARLFDRGVRGDDSNGSGLGLCIAKRLMSEQGGSIAARPRLGGGTSFVVRLRRTPSKRSPSPVDQ